MKVPTYRSQTAIPKQGRGLFLSAQLNPGAMMAPGQAAEAQGLKLAQAGSQIAEWGYKKLQISAQSEALGAASSMEVELAQKSHDALQVADMAQAEKQFRRDAKLLSDRYSATLKTPAARRAFSAEALKLQTRALIGFTKANNKRVVEANKANLDTAVAAEQRAMSDLSTGTKARENAYVHAILSVDHAKAELGAEEHAKRINKINKDAVTNTLTAYLNQPDAKVLQIVKAFREGRLDDPIIREASKHLSADDLAKVADSGVQRANRIIKLRQNIREEREAKASETNNALYLNFINTDWTDSVQVELARHTFEILKSANYFDTADKMNTAQNLLRGRGDFPRASDVTNTREGDLLAAASVDKLTYEMLDDARAQGHVTFNFYREMVANLETEFNEATKAGIQIFRDTFKYSEYADKGELSDISRQAFNKAALQFRKWTEENRKAPRALILETARDIAQGSVGKFEEVIRKQRMAVIRATYKNLSGPAKKGIPELTDTNFDAFKQAVEKAAAAPHSNNMLVKRLLKAVTQELAIRAFD